MLWVFEPFFFGHCLDVYKYSLKWRCTVMGKDWNPFLTAVSCQCRPVNELLRFIYTVKENFSLSSLSLLNMNILCELIWMSYRFRSNTNEPLTDIHVVLLIHCYRLSLVLEPSKVHLHLTNANLIAKNFFDLCDQSLYICYKHT